MQHLRHVVAELLDCHESGVPNVVERLVTEADLGYTVLEPGGQERVLLEELRLELPGTHPDLTTWEACWREVRDRYTQSFNNTEELNPEYLFGTGPVRLLGRYVQPETTWFLRDMQSIIRAYIADRFLRDARRVVELGCGSGFNLVALRDQLGGEIELIGADWSEGAVETVNSLNLPNVAARRFDMLHPEENYSDFLAGGTVLTMGALEQLGKDFGPLLTYLLAARPALCVHVEPLVELYNETSDLFDYVAARYHRGRGYLEGFLPALTTLDKYGKIEIVGVHHTHFGARHNDGFSWVVWRPR